MPSYQKLVVLDNEDTDWCSQTADVSHQLEGNMLIKSTNEFISCCAVLSKDVANTIPLRLIAGSDHTSGFYLPAKRNCCKKWLKIQRQESSSDEWMRLRSYKTKSKLIQKRFSCPESMLRTQVLLVKISTVRHPSDDFTLNHHHLERTNDITYWLIHYDLSFSYWPWLGIREWEVLTSSPHSAAVTSASHTSWLHRWQQQWQQLQ